LTLEALLNQLPIPNRPGALVPPRFPPYFQTVDRERRARMWEKCAELGSELAKQIQQIWIPLFTPPAPPTYIPKDVFFAKMKEGIQKRFADVTAAVEKIRSRGGSRREKKLGIRF
jgi:transposase